MLVVHYVGGLREQNIVLLISVRIFNRILIRVLLLQVYFLEVFGLVHVELTVLSSKVHLLECYGQVVKLKLR